MTSPLASGNRWAVLGVAVFALGCLALASSRGPALALVNESPSLPQGLYVRRVAGVPEAGAVVAVAQPPAVRRYLGALGMPGSILLIKRVAAIGGERVCRAGFEVRTPRRSVAVHLVDRRGLALPQWRDCRRLAPDEVFLLGDTADSLDSRYFGPVRSAEILGVYRVVVSW